MVAFLNSKFTVFLSYLSSNLIARFTCSYNYRYSFGTKNIYEWATNISPFDTLPGNKCREREFKHHSRMCRSCTPIHANVIFRHGSRYPSASNVKKFNIALEKIRADSKLGHVREWKCPFDENDDKRLSAHGRSEIRGIGVRLGQKYCKMLSKNGADSFDFVSSNKQRALESAKSFQEGLFQVLNFTLPYDRSITLNNELMRFFELCDKYQDVLNQKDIMQEYYDFRRGSEMSAVARNMENLLEISEGTLTSEDLQNMHKMAAYYLAFANNSSLSNLFSSHSTDVLEYLADLKHYYKKSYAFELNYLITCSLIQDVVNRFNDVITLRANGHRYKTGVFQFGHAETIIPLYTVLGLFQDSVVLNANNYATASRRRAFRTSLMAPFSANVGFILHDCRPIGCSRSLEDYHVEVVVNEKSVALPGCYDLCPLSRFHEIMRFVLDSNFKKLCSVDSHTEL